MDGSIDAVQTSVTFGTLLDAFQLNERKVGPFNFEPVAIDTTISRSLRMRIDIRDATYGRRLYFEHKCVVYCVAYTIDLPSWNMSGAPVKSRSASFNHRLTAPRHNPPVLFLPNSFLAA
jgi:hypothetical protein